MALKKSHAPKPANSHLSEVLMPALSPMLDEGTLVKWLVQVGELVVGGQLIAEIETDKATMEFEACEDGIVVELLLAEGTANVKAGTPIAIFNHDARVVAEARRQTRMSEFANFKSHPTFGMF